MKKYRLCPVLAFAAVLQNLIILTAVFAGSENRPEQEKIWEQAFSLRQQAVEEKYGLKFEAGWKPRVVFGIPDYYLPKNYGLFEAEYDLDTQSFKVHPGFRKEEMALKFFQPGIKSYRAHRYSPDYFRQMIDHELGHALADQFSRRQGKGIWPDFNHLDTLPWTKRYGIIMQFEGVGKYSSFVSVINPDQALEVYWPEEANEWFFIFSRENTVYYGGYTLVKPILDRFRGQGLAYLIKNPFSFPDGNVKAAARNYQAKAIFDLAPKEGER